MLNQEIFLAQRQIYYSRIFVGLELVKALGEGSETRELAFITAKESDPSSRLNVRYLFAIKYDLFKMHIEELKFLDKNINLYRSLATFSKDIIKPFSYNLKNRLEQPEYKELNDHYENYCENYSFLIDFDFKKYSNLDFAYKDAKQIKSIFEDFKIPYGVWNTSYKGLHFFIDGKYFPKERGDDWLNKRLDLFHEISYNMKGIYAIGDEERGIDTSIFDSKRISKLPYSVVGDGSVCCPLSDEQFEKFFSDPEIVSIPRVLREVTLKNRGLLIRNLELGEEKLKENVKNFVKEFK
jgi:hypothetical protein